MLHGRVKNAADLRALKNPEIENVFQGLIFSLSARPFMLDDLPPGAFLIRLRNLPVHVLCVPGQSR